MPPRKTKKAPTPAGSTDAESDVVDTPSHQPVIPLIVQNIDKIQNTRSGVRQSIEKNNAKKIADLKARITKHYQSVESKRSSFIGKRLDRLAKALSQRATCEEVTENLNKLLSKEGAHLAVLMKTVYTERGKAAQSAATAALRKKDS